LGNAEQTIDDIKKKGEVGLQTAKQNYEIIKKKGLQLVDEAKATSDQIKAAIVEAYTLIQNLFKINDNVVKEIEVVKVQEGQTTSNKTTEAGHGKP